METLNHLFLQCNFATQCWASLNLVNNLDLNPFNILETFRARLHVPFIMEVIILMSWSIWMARNGLIFEARGPTVQYTIDFFKSNFAMVIHCAKSKNVQSMTSCLENFSP